MRRLGVYLHPVAGDRYNADRPHRHCDGTRSRDGDDHRATQAKA
jgi:hypothetical protein